MNIALIEGIFKNRKSRSMQYFNRFSVLVPMVTYHDEIHILFEVRSAEMKSQPNDVCFPGGQVEKGESPAYTAVRETYEELGIQMDKIRIIKELDYMIIHSSSIMNVFLGEIKYEDLQKMDINKKEVQEVFLVPLNYFLTEEPLCHETIVKSEVKEDFPFHLIANGKDYDWRHTKVPVYFYKYDTKIIWGLTARIIKHLAKIVKNEMNRQNFE
ncbi:MAG: CoA pyrophosphatase [Peptostreptococcales bacterium]|jgi:coenzyme A diphosphatase NUDT7